MEFEEITNISHSKSSMFNFSNLKASQDSTLKFLLSTKASKIQSFDVIRKLLIKIGKYE